MKNERRPDSTANEMRPVRSDGRLETVNRMSCYPLLLPFRLRTEGDEGRKE